MQQQGNIEKELRASALHWLQCQQPINKRFGVKALKAAFDHHAITINTTRKLQAPIDGIPGRPDSPTLVPAQQLSKRPMNTPEGRASLIHALAHIEFNAINLALDAVWRFPDMPENYYADWLTVAAEEAYHFSLLNDHLNTLGYVYGSFAAHNALWQMVEDTKNNVLARMALVPRTMEARGLDANLPLRNKLAQAGDSVATDILDIILEDEIGHVAIGNYWYHWLCRQRNLAPINTFEMLCQQYKAPKMRPPFNIEARRLAGFTEEELTKLKANA